MLQSYKYCTLSYQKVDNSDFGKRLKPHKTQVSSVQVYILTKPVFYMHSGIVLSYYC